MMNIVATASGSGLDLGLFGEIIEFVKTCMTLFSEFPLNIILVASLAGVGFGIFRKAKKAAK